MCGVILGQQQSPSLPHHHHRMLQRDWRRRSADVGGLHLATEGMGQGQGWMGGDSIQVETDYAELLSDMYTETLNSVNDNSLESIPADLPESVQTRLIHSLDRWHFEPHKLPDEEVLACTLLLFEALFRVEGMREAIPISMQQISGFIHHLRRIYRYENTYHNFEHALDVLQACQSYLKTAGMVPPPTILFEPNRLWKSNKAFNCGSLISCLGLRELFGLYIAAIGHDVGHPGFTNGFMKTVKTPLSMVFDSSALEHMHCQLLLRVMRHHGLGVLLDDGNRGMHFKKIVWQSVIATDMGLHKDFMERFKNLVDGEAGPLCQRQILVCQALLKNADISNPTRPFYVSKHWANALMQEWTAQAQLEEEYHLKPSVMSNTTKDSLQEANSQIFFITTFAKPLLELMANAVPELSMYKRHCRKNLETWLRKQADLKASKFTPAMLPLAPSSNSTALFTPPPPPSSSAYSISPPPILSRQSDSYLTAFPLTLPTLHPKILEPLFPRFDHDSTSGSPSDPISPCDSEGSASVSLFSPLSDTSSSLRCSSSSSTAGSGSSASSTGKNSRADSLNGHQNSPLTPNIPTIDLNVPTPTPHAAIRAAGRLGSIGRKDGLSMSMKSIFGSSSGSKKQSRNSWCAPTNGLFPSSSSGPGLGWHSPTLSQIPGSGSSSVVGSPAIPTATMPPSLALVEAVSVANEVKIERGRSGAEDGDSGRQHGITTFDGANAPAHPPLAPSAGPFLMARPIKLQVSP